jgi:aryl-alcohol dehydrogenase
MSSKGSSIPDIFIPRMIDLYAQGRVPFDKLIRFYPFDTINQAVEDQRLGKAIKPVLEVYDEIPSHSKQPRNDK